MYLVLVCQRQQPSLCMRAVGVGCVNLFCQAAGDPVVLAGGCVCPSFDIVCRSFGLVQMQLNKRC